MIVGDSMTTKRKIKLKPEALKIIKIGGILLLIVAVAFIFYQKNIHDLTRLNYSRKAAQNILFKFKKNDVIQIGKNKTLNQAFESELYQEKNFTTYSKVNYQNHQDLIKNINQLVKIGYTNSEINMILSHGSNQDVKDFMKRKKVKYLEEFYTIDYAKLINYDRYVAYMDKSREDEETSVLYVNLGLDKEDYTDYTEVKDFSYTMLVNKHYKLNEKFIPDHLKTIDTKYASEKGIKANHTATIYAKKMINKAKKEGYNLTINSAYRSYKDQEEIVNTYKELYGDSYVEKYVLQAGFSEHQTGLGFDFGSTDTKIFVQSNEYKWMEDNCYKYGFIHRFKSNYENITGIKREAWHYRYVGKKVAKYIYENDITLEEYYAKFLN